MPKNIFVTACYEITKEVYGAAKTEDYREITSLCVDSFRKNLKDIDEIVVLYGKEETYHQVFKDIFYRLMNLHLYEDNCNILFVDSDTSCVKPTEIFGKYDKFMMFSIINQFRTAYPNKVPSKLYDNLTPWFMSNVRYYTCGLSSDIWNIGKKLADNWLDVWAYECIVYNSMMHSQGISKKELSSYHMPILNYQYVTGQEQLNGIELNEAQIVHCQATRGAKTAVEKMKALVR